MFPHGKACQSRELATSDSQAVIGVPCLVGIAYEADQYPEQPAFRWRGAVVVEQTIACAYQSRIPGWKTDSVLKNGF